MKENIEKECGACPFFKFCAAYIIEEKFGKNWRELYCFKDFKDCIHFEDRKKLKLFIVRKKERFGLLQ